MQGKYLTTFRFWHFPCWVECPPSVQEFALKVSHINHKLFWTSPNQIEPPLHSCFKQKWGNWNIMYLLTRGTTTYARNNKWIPCMQSKPALHNIWIYWTLYFVSQNTKKRWILNCNLSGTLWRRLPSQISMGAAPGKKNRIESLTQVNSLFGSLWSLFLLVCHVAVFPILSEWPHNCTTHTQLSATHKNLNSIAATLLIKEMCTRDELWR